MLEGKKILLGITASIAAYKSILLLRLLVKSGAEVKVIMTPGAKDFVSPLVLATLSGNEVVIDIQNDNQWANHVMLGRWADIFVIAPLSCNTLAKMASGLCDNLLLAVYLSATCPVIAAPAMDEDMWRHATTKRNLTLLQKDGIDILPVNKGELGSGLTGEGRMQEPEQIMKKIIQIIGGFKLLSGKKVLITAGPTHEHIDPVRFISNHSTGKMGLALAEQFNNAGAEVLVIAGPGVSSSLNISTINVLSAEQMYNEVMSKASEQDVIIMAAAVADYTFLHPGNKKIKKKDSSLTLELTKTKDILKALGTSKKKGQLLIGFALETNNGEANAKEKLKSKNADCIILNSLEDTSSGFGYDTNKITAFLKNGTIVPFELKSKMEVANDIVNLTIEMINEKN
ncbi:MAG: coaBC [Chitinophagaceae bacterium]|nr:coaBC [Chitinophagaceae bacterium]